MRKAGSVKATELLMQGRVLEALFKKRITSEQPVMKTDFVVLCFFKRIELVFPD